MRVITFHDPNEENGYLSNWYLSDFEVRGVKYTSMEQYMMHQKAVVFGNAEIGGDAKVEGAADYIVFKNWWSSGRYFTWTRTNNMWKVGCFYGTGEQLIEKAYNDSEKSGREYEKIVRYSETVN